MLANHKKGVFFIEKSILGWKSTTDKVAFQSYFKFKVEDINFFYLYALTCMLHYRIYGFLLTKLSVRKTGSSKLQFEESTNENTVFGYYLKGGFSSFFYPLTTPLWGVLVLSILQKRLEGGKFLPPSSSSKKKEKGEVGKIAEEDY